MERMVQVARKLRIEENYNGYIHLKSILENMQISFFSILPPSGKYIVTPLEKGQEQPDLFC
ncbi:MAG: hypothetical protein AB7S72_00735 [Draconibacterium sp.]